MRPRSVIPSFCCFFLFLSVMPGIANAQTLNFTGGSNGFGDPNDFNSSTSWGGNGTPNSNTTVNFSLAGTYQVNFFSYSGNGASGNANFSNGTADIRFRGSQIWAISGSLTVRDGGTINLIRDQSFSNPAINVSGDSFFGFSGVGTGSVGTGIALSNTGAGWIGFGNGSSGSVTVNGAWHNGLDLTVGNNSGTGSLVINSGGIVTNKVGYLGRDALSVGTATVTGIWNNSSQMNVGYRGTGSLNIQSGGQVSNSFGYLGFLSGASGNATVTGAGSRWINRSLFLGGDAFSNGGSGTLTVNSGGRVQVGDDTFAIGVPQMVIGDQGSGGIFYVRNGSNVSNSGASVLGGSANYNGVGTVTGSGSQWINSGSLSVGENGFGQLTISSGGVAGNSAGYVARRAGSSGNVNVSGTGSHWNNSGRLDIGVDSIGELSVTSGGLVSSFVGNLGYTVNGTGFANISGTNSRWTNATDLFIGNSGQGNLNIQGGGQVANTIGYVGLNEGSQGQVVINGNGSRWNNSGNLLVGAGGTGTLNVGTGGFVDSASAYIGGYLNDFIGGAGTATISGPGSQWTNSGILSVGEHGGGTLNVSSGGVVSNTMGYIGHRSGSTGVATVTGNESQWYNSGLLVVGDDADGTLVVDAGGMVTNTGGYIGRNSGSTGIATVTFAELINSGNLLVGAGGTGTLNVGTGGFVDSASAYIGGYLNDYIGGAGTATISGPGSQWTNSGILSVGEHGGGTLNVSSGGVVSNTMGYIGHRSGSTGVATVTGNESQWNNSETLYIGYEGDGTLVVEAGGMVTNTHGYIGFKYGSTGGIATVSGNGSQWYNSGSLFVGVHDGTLVVEAGGLVANTVGSIGRFAGSTGIATVTGNGSRWYNSETLYIGYEGDGTLVVEAGGRATSKSCQIGLVNGSVGSVTVTGSGSQWINSGWLRMGAGGVGLLEVNTGGRVQIGDDAFSFGDCQMVVGVSGSEGEPILMIGNGSTVINNGSSFLGGSANHGGTAIVSGAGSQWTNSGNLVVGAAGSGILNVQFGGLVSNDNAYIGGFRNDFIGGAGTATISGSGSQWNSSGILSVGEHGGGTLDVSRRAVVSNTLGYIGRLSGSTGIATVAGNGSQWNNSGNLYIGGSETASGGTGSLVISENGLVSVAGTTRLWGDGSVILDTGGILDTNILDLAAGTFSMLNGGTLITDRVLGNLYNESGILAPGNSPGLTEITGNYTQGALGTLQIELGGLLPGDFDSLLVGGDLTLDGFLDVSMWGSFQLGAGQEFVIADVSGTLSGQFSGLADRALIGTFNGVELFIDYGTGGSNNVSFFTAVPEPGGVGLMLVGLALAAGRRRRRP